MDYLYKSKADPSIQQEWPREAPRWPRNIQTLVKTVTIVALLAGGYVAFLHTRLDKQRYSWFWDLEEDGYGTQAGAHATSKGSQYLLGVGKADITGYVIILFGVELIANKI